MKKKNILTLTIIFILASGILLAFNTSEKKTSPCTESGMDECCQKKDETPKEGAVWESLSRQFLTVSAVD